MNNFIKDNKIKVYLAAVLAVIVIAVGIWLSIKPDSSIGADTDTAAVTDPVTPSEETTADVKSPETTEEPATDIPVSSAAPESSDSPETKSVSTSPATSAEVTTKDVPHIVVTPGDDTTSPAETTRPVETTKPSGTGDVTTPPETTTEAEVTVIVIPGDTEEPQIVETLAPICMHTSTEKRDAKTATCTSEGYTGNTYCRDCGKLIGPGEKIAKLAHKEVTVKGIAATCTSAGLSDGSKCSVCGITIKERSVINALGHKPITVAAVPATCTSIGTAAGTKCSVCGTVLSGFGQISPLEHTPITDKAVDPTCGSTGLTEGSHCSVCGTVIVAQQRISSTNAHNYVKDRVVEPTVGMYGYTLYKCTKCGQYDPNGHDLVPMLEGDYALQHKGDPRADLSNVFPPQSPQTVQSIDIYMSYDFSPDLSMHYDERRGRWYYDKTEQKAVLIARDGTAITGTWKYYATTLKEDTELGLPLPGWTFFMDITVYPVGESTYGWCYNKIYNTLVYGWWMFGSYGVGGVHPLDTVPGKTAMSLSYRYEACSPDDSATIKAYKTGW